MAERVYRDQTDKFTLISTTIKDISDFNDSHIHYHGFENYRYQIASAHRTCVGFGIQSWSSISMHALSACDMWDVLKLSPVNSFLSQRVYEPLHSKLAALRIMLNNFSVFPSNDDQYYWKFVNDQLEIIDAAGENPVRDARRRKTPQNPPREDHIHHGNPGDPLHNQPDIYEVDAMLSQLKHYI